MVELVIVARGADIGILNDFGETAIYCVSHAGKRCVVKFLRANRANISTRHKSNETAEDLIREHSIQKVDEKETSLTETALYQKEDESHQKGSLER